MNAMQKFNPGAFQEAQKCQVVIASHLISGKRLWYIGLEMKDPGMGMTPQQLEIARMGWIDIKTPFVGTEEQKDFYIEALIEQCAKAGVPLKEIHIAPISLAK